ncbi:hypothetical protein GW916_02570 [bacterium]|nr:hypothetical protein [bacterium]
MQKTQDELANQNCGMIKDSLRCENSSEDKSAIYCSARTERCGDVSSDGFLGVTCNGEKVKIKDRKLSATWSKGIFSTWVREMCIMKAN